MPEQDARPLVIVSKSEPNEAVHKLQGFGLNAVEGEAGTDYVWYPHGQQWGIERKTVSNLLGSLKDRQLVEQTQRGAEQFDRYVILVEGEYRRNPNGMLAYYSPRDPRANYEGWVESGWQYNAISGMLFALQLVGDRNNVLVTHWPVLYDSPTAIASIVFATCAPESRKFTRERQRPDLPAQVALGGKLYSDAVWALCALPGCGPEVAQALIAKYGRLDAAIAAIASGDGVESVIVHGKRLGKSRAEKLREAVTTKF